MDGAKRVAVVGTAAMAASAAGMEGKAIDTLVVDSVSPRPIEPEYPEYDIVNPDGTVEKADNGDDAPVTRNAKGYVVEPRRMVPFRPSPKKAAPLKYQRIPMCGHKFIPQQEPRHKGCESCWFTFFQVHGELTQAVEEVYQKQGEDFLAKLKGRAYVTNFLKFMSTVAAFQASMAAAQAEQEKNAITSTGGAVSTDEAEGGIDPTHGLSSDPEQASLFETGDDK